MKQFDVLIQDVEHGRKLNIKKKRITDKITETINLRRVTCMVNITGSTAIV